MGKHVGMAINGAVGELKYIHLEGTEGWNCLDGVTVLMLAMRVRVLVGAVLVGQGITSAEFRTPRASVDRRRREAGLGPSLRSDPAPSKLELIGHSSREWLHIIFVIGSYGLVKVLI